MWLLYPHKDERRIGELWHEPKMPQVDIMLKIEKGMEALVSKCPVYKRIKKTFSLGARRC